jgi:hypothetical protein
VVAGGVGAGVVVEAAGAAALPLPAPLPVPSVVAGSAGVVVLGVVFGVPLPRWWPLGAASAMAGTSKIQGTRRNM